MMVGYYNYTVILTYLGLAASVAGMTLACSGKLTAALVCLLVSGICDGVDGKVAGTRKRTEEEKRFGIQIDSLCDVICFGVFPAILGYAVGLDSPAALPVLIFFVLAGVIRLGYFNVTEEIRQTQTDAHRREYKGLPISADALLVPFMFCFRSLLGAAFPAAYAVFLLVVGFAFIAPFRFPKPSGKKYLLVVAAGVGLFLCFVVFRL